MTARAADRTHARAELAPEHTLRAAINLANPLLVSGRSPLGEPTGVAPSMAAAVAAALDVALQLVPYPSPAAISDRVGSGEWAIALIGADPARAETIAFSSAYVEIVASFLVDERSRAVESADVDSEGATIIAVDRSAYDLWLRANLRHASLVHVPDDAAAIALFRERPDFILAGLRPTLAAHRALEPDARILSGHFMTVEQAIGTPRANLAGAQFLREFTRRAIDDGLVARLLREFAVDSLIRVGPSEPAT